MSSSFGHKRPGSDPHRWIDLTRYLSIHDAAIRRFPHFLVENRLDVVLLDERTVRLTGRLRCQHGLFLDVVETLELNDRNQVHLIRCKYHAGLEGDLDRSIFRYDNAHRYRREGHVDEFHKHQFDHYTWQEIVPPRWIGEDNWPTLDGVIEELEGWWYETGRLLDLD